MMSLTMFGLPMGVIIPMFIGIVYSIGAIVFVRVYLRDRGELMAAFLAFLISMATANIFMGLGMYTGNMIFMFLTMFAIFTGSAFLLKFPITVFPQQWRQPLFYIFLVIVLAVNVWMIVSPIPGDQMSEIAMIFMIIVNGIITGFFMIWTGIRAASKSVKIKAIGGGLGVSSCCLVSHVLFSTQVDIGLISSVFFQFIAPFLILGSVYAGRRVQNQSTTNPSQTSPVGI